MNELIPSKEQYPYCGESIEILIDGSVYQQNYIEDCQVCCQPMTVDVTVTETGEIWIHLQTENES